MNIKLVLFFISFSIFAAQHAIKKDHDFVLQENEIGVNKLHYGLKTFKTSGRKWRNSGYENAYQEIAGQSELITVSKVGFLLDLPFDGFTKDVLFSFERLQHSYPANEFNLVRSSDPFTFDYSMPLPLIGNMTGRTTNEFFYGDPDQALQEAAKIPEWLRNRPGQKFIYQLGTRYNRFFSVSKLYMHLFDMGNGQTFVYTYGAVGLRQRNRVLSMFINIGLAEELRNYREGFLRVFTARD